MFLLLLTGLLGTACDCGGGGATVDGGAPDGSVADGGGPDGGSDGGSVAIRPSSVQLVGGGGEARSETRSLRLTIGAPQPMGEAASADRAVELGGEVGP